MPPSLDLLRVFESAARQLSFTAAAEELGTTQPAVSQQIKRLEKELATPLFQRVHRGIVLTDAGQAPAPPRGRRPRDDRCRHRRAGRAPAPRGAPGGHRLRLRRLLADAAPSALPPGPSASGREPGDQRARPGRQRGDIDVAILFGDGRSKHGEAHRLFREEVFPVCSPRLVEGLQLPLAKAHLARLPMLHLKPAQHARWFDWPALFEALAIDRQPIPAVLSFDNYTLLIQAAIAGQGVAIGWRHLVDGLLEQGLLCRPIGESCLSRYGYYAVLPERKRRQRLVDGFVDWLQAELQAGGA